MAKYKNTVSREEMRDELDESYETEYYKYRVSSRAPWRSRFSIAFNIIVPVLIGLIFQTSIGSMIGWIVLYFAYDFIVHAFRVGRWNGKVKRYGLESFLAQSDPLYKKEEK